MSRHYLLMRSLVMVFLVAVGNVKADWFLSQAGVNVTNVTISGRTQFTTSVPCTKSTLACANVSWVFQAFSSLNNADKILRIGPGTYYLLQYTLGVPLPIGATLVGSGSTGNANVTTTLVVPTMWTVGTSGLTIRNLRILIYDSTATTLFLTSKPVVLVDVYVGYYSTPVAATVSPGLISIDATSSNLTNVHVDTATTYIALRASTNLWNSTLTTTVLCVGCSILDSALLGPVNSSTKSVMGNVTLNPQAPQYINSTLLKNVSGLNMNSVVGGSVFDVWFHNIRCNSNVTFEGVQGEVCGQNMVLTNSTCGCITPLFTCDPPSGMCLPSVSNATASTTINSTFLSLPSGGYNVWGQGDYDDIFANTGDVLVFPGNGIAPSSVVLYSDFWSMQLCASSNFIVLAAPFQTLGYSFNWTVPAAGVYYVASYEFCLLGAQFVVYATDRDQACFVNRTTNRTQHCVIPFTSPQNFSFSSCVTPSLFNVTSTVTNVSCLQGICVPCTSPQSIFVRIRPYTRMSMSAQYNNVTLLYGSTLAFTAYRIPSSPKIAGRPDPTVRPNRVRRIVLTRYGQPCLSGSIIGETVLDSTFAPSKTFLMPVGLYVVQLFSASSNVTDVTLMCNASSGQGLLVFKFYFTVLPVSVQPCYTLQPLYVFDPSWVVPSGYLAFTFPITAPLSMADCISLCASNHICQYAMYSISDQSCWMMSYRVVPGVSLVSMTPLTGNTPVLLRYIAITPLQCPSYQPRVALQTYYVSPGGSDTGNCGFPTSPCGTVGYVVNGVGVSPVTVIMQNGTYYEALAIYQPNTTITTDSANNANVTVFAVSPDTILAGVTVYTVAVYAPFVSLFNFVIREGVRATQRDVLLYIAPNGTYAFTQYLVLRRLRTTEIATLGSRGTVVEGNNMFNYQSNFYGTLDVSIEVNANQTTIQDVYLTSTSTTGILVDRNAWLCNIDWPFFGGGEATAVDISGVLTTVLLGQFSPLATWAIVVRNGSQAPVLSWNSLDNNVYDAFLFTTSGKLSTYVTNGYINPPNQCYYLGGPPGQNVTVPGQMCTPGASVTPQGGCVCNAPQVCVPSGQIAFCELSSVQLVTPTLTGWAAGYSYADNFFNNNFGDIFVFDVIPGNTLGTFTNLAAARACLVTQPSLYTPLVTVPANATQPLRFYYTIASETTIFVEPSNNCSTSYLVRTFPLYPGVNQSMTFVQPNVCPQGITTSCTSFWGPQEYSPLNVTAYTTIAFPPSSLEILMVPLATYLSCVIRSDSRQLVGLRPRTQTYYTPPLDPGTYYFMSSADLCLQGLAKFIVNVQSAPPPPPTPAPPPVPDPVVSVASVTTINGMLNAVFSAGPYARQLQQAFLLDVLFNFKSALTFLQFNASNMSITATYSGSVIIVWQFNVRLSVANNLSNYLPIVPVTNISHLQKIYATQIDPDAVLSVDPTRSNYSSCYAAWILATQYCGYAEDNSTCACYQNMSATFSYCKTDTIATVSWSMVFSPRQLQVCAFASVNVNPYSYLLTTSGHIVSRSVVPCWLAILLMFPIFSIVVFLI